MQFSHQKKYNNELHVPRVRTQTVNNSPNGTLNFEVLIEKLTS